MEQNGPDDQRALRKDTEISFIGNARGAQLSVSQSAVTDPDHPLSVPQRIDSNLRIAREPSGVDLPRDPLSLPLPAKALIESSAEQQYCCLSSLELTKE